MPQVVTTGSLIRCSMGVLSVPLAATPGRMTDMGSLPAATVMDYLPGINIPSFGLCRSPLHPMVAAILAVTGELVPMPCTPVPTGPWMPGSPTVLVRGQPALTSTSMCMCAYQGVITVNMPGQVTVQAP